MRWFFLWWFAGASGLSGPFDNQHDCISALQRGKEHYFNVLSPTAMMSGLQPFGVCFQGSQGDDNER